MDALVLKTNKTINDYGDGIKKLLLEINDDIINNIKDGIGMKLANQNGDETSVYNFLKNQGYEVNYKDFLLFNEDSKKIMDENEDAIKSMLEEQKTVELSDNDLEQVAGGMSWWKKLLIGIGVALVIAAIAIVTVGIGLAVSATITAASGSVIFSVGAAVTAGLAIGSTYGGIAAVVGAAGAGAIAAGTLTK